MSGSNFAFMYSIEGGAIYRQDLSGSNGGQKEQVGITIVAYEEKAKEGAGWEMAAKEWKEAADNYLEELYEKGARTRPVTSEEIAARVSAQDAKIDEIQKSLASISSLLEMMTAPQITEK